MRYEIKIPVLELSEIELENMIKLNPYCFNEIFYERRVNNIYFDDENYSAFNDNSIGSARRIKLRIRWYGETFGMIQPVLELKIKNGQVGSKLSYKLNDLTIRKGSDLSYLTEQLLSEQLDAQIKEYLQTSKPVLINSYKRKYYLSFDGRLRITLDKKIEYFRICNSDNIEPISDERHVIEIKYDIENADLANKVTEHFHLRVDKNSKFTRGISLLQY